MQVRTIIFCTLAIVIRSDSDFPVIQTRSGPVQGHQSTNTLGKPIIFYSEIPYAEPPVGSLRFLAPVAVKPWTDVLQASKSHASCIQQMIPGFAFVGPNRDTETEDCLKLNIMVPSPTPSNASVLVYLHGGAFNAGTSIDSPLSKSAMVSEEKLIVVSINYRLNVFGFMKMSTPETPGNLALMDQRLALIWIKENIASFGGNPHSITVLGMSAGSISLSNQILANKGKDLFHRAILMSGVMNEAAYLEPQETIDKSDRIADYVGCSPNNVNSFLKCLQQVSVEKLLEAEDKTRSSHMNFFRPTVDGVYVQENWKTSLEAGRFYSGPILVGVTSNEGGRFSFVNNRDLFEESDNGLTEINFKDVFTKLLVLEAKGAIQEAAALFYKNFSKPDDPIMYRDAAGRAYGDYMFVCGVNYFCDRYSRFGNTVYKYVYDQIITLTGSDWMSPSHASDLPIAMGLALGTGMMSDQEMSFTRRLMKQWATFARTGNPNIAGDGSTFWPRYNLVNKPYMNLAFQPHVGNHFRAAECSFWNELHPTLRRTAGC